MANVFLSYDREDAAKARKIATALDQAGHSVWWDRHIKGGAQYSKEIEDALKRADAVVVLWSQRSIDSAWVRDEAALGRDNGRLVPIRLDKAEPPLGFRQYLTIDLSRWKGGLSDASFRELKTAVQALGGSTGLAAEPSIEKPERTHPYSRHWFRLALAALALAVVVAALFFGTPWGRVAATPVVAVRAAAADANSRTLARDLFVQLGNVQATTDAVQLVEENARAAPDLILEVSAATSDSQPSANLVLLRGKDRQLLSSHAFEATDGAAVGLKQAIAMQATRLLRCAADALDPENGTLRHATLKLYLSACNGFAMVYGSPDGHLLVRQFEQIVRLDPGFVPAWKQLLLIEASVQALPSEQTKASPEILRNHIAAARRLGAAIMPEVGIAQLELLAPTDFNSRVRLSDELVQRFPDEPFVLIGRSDQLMRVGRMNDAVDDAERAQRLDPASPVARNEYIRSLAYSGRIPRAFQELTESAPLALGAQNLREAHFRLNMRYGDPRVALQILRSHGTSKQHETFLEARIAPTPANIEKAIAASRTTAAKAGTYGAHAEVLTAFGRDEELYHLLMRLPTGRLDAWLAGTLFRPNLKTFRQNPRFLSIAHRFGMLAYWQESGEWPDFCADEDLPYDCKTEAGRASAATRTSRS